MEQSCVSMRYWIYGAEKEDISGYGSAPQSEKRSLLVGYLPHTDLSHSLVYFSSLHQTFVSCFYQLRGGGS